MKSIVRVVLSSCLLLAALLVEGQVPVPTSAFLTKKTAPSSAPVAIPEFAKPRIIRNYGQLPLAFEANQGQTDPQVKFLSRGSGYTLFLTSTEAVLALPSPGESAASQQAPIIPSVRLPHTRLVDSRPTRQTVVRMKLIGANAHAHVKGLEELPGKSNYFIGNDPAKWCIDVPTYAQVEYQSVYPGVNLIYYGNQRRLEHDFVVAPGADPSLIRIAFLGADDITLGKNGNLVLRATDGEVTLQAPHIYQEFNGTHESVAGHYVLRDKSQVGFELSAYDARKPLIIDPVLSYATYLGGSGTDSAQAIAVDASGSAYVTGYTTSANFSTANAFQGVLVGSQDIFVAKLNAAGNTLVYSTYLGGNSGSVLVNGQGIAVDASGNAYVVGRADANFPTTPGAFSTTFKGGTVEAVVTKLNSSGNGLVYSTYLGGSFDDEGAAIALDASGNAYVTGITFSTDFPTMNAFQTSLDGNSDAFVTKLNGTGSGLIYSTYLGGRGLDGGQAIAVDASGNTYITGFTQSPPSFPTIDDFPTVNPFQAACNNTGPSGFCQDAFVAKIDASKAGSASLVYSTYLGGSSNEAGSGIAVDSSGNAYVVGSTISPDFPRANPFQAALNGPQDAFVTKLNATGNSLIYSTYLGGSLGETANAIAVDSLGNVYITGETTSIDFPIVNAIQLQAPSNRSAYVTIFNVAGSGLIYSTYFGGTYPSGVGNDHGSGIAVDSAGNAYVTGSTTSTTFPTQNPLQPTFGGGGGDAFVARIAPVAISVTTNLAAATFTITGPAMYSGSGTSFTQAVAPVGGYTITYGTVTGYTTPPTETKTLSGGGTISFVGTYQVVARPMISVSLGGLTFPAGGTVTFPATPLGATSAVPGTISNTGAAPLHILGTTIPSPFALFAPLPTTIPAGGTVSFGVTFSPNGPGPFAATLNITSDASNSPTLNIPLQGTSVIPAITRTAPYDFFASCNDTVEIAGGIGSQASATVVSDPKRGVLSLNVQAEGIAANATGKAGVGIYYNPVFSGMVKIRTIARVGPGFDFVGATALPEIGEAGIASVESDVYISAIPPVGMQSTNRFRSAIVLPTPTPSLNPFFDSEQHVYNPPELFTAEHMAAVRSGQRLFVCAGVRTKTVSTAFPGVFSFSKAFYTVEILRIEITPQ